MPPSWAQSPLCQSQIPAPVRLAATPWLPVPRESAAQIEIASAPDSMVQTEPAFVHELMRRIVDEDSARTDWEEAVGTYAGTDTLLQKTLHPMRDVLDRDAEGMEKAIRDIQAAALDRVSYCVIANGIDNPCGDVEKTLAKCDEWVTVAAACLS